MGKILKVNSKPVVLVDIGDNILGFKEKFATHKIPVPLHRAISILIYNKDKTEMLITKRSFDKPTWGGFWTNAVCTHPYPDESYQRTAERRIFEELGFKTKLKEVFVFDYKAEMDGGVWGECELDHVFEGRYEGSVMPDPVEIEGYEWVKINELKSDLKENPGKYTPWFKIILGRIDV